MYLIHQIDNNDIDCSSKWYTENITLHAHDAHGIKSNQVMPMQLKRK